MPNAADKATLNAIKRVEIRRLSQISADVIDPVEAMRKRSFLDSYLALYAPLRLKRRVKLNFGADGFAQDRKNIASYFGSALEKFDAN